jgi:hypothetical protein
MAARSTTRPASAKTAKAGPKPKIFVTDEDMLHFQKKDGGEIILDLDFPSSILRQMLAARDLEQDEQFEIVMKALGDEALQEEVNGLGALEYMRLVTGFFNEFEKALGLSLGESEGSSNSSTSTE